MARRDRALRPPDESALDFTRFPRKTLHAGSEWFRQHRDRPTSDRGAWYFASYPVGGEGDGRFDLAEPGGTCYLSSSERGAVNELVGPACADRGWVDADLVSSRVVSKLRLPGDVKAANATSGRALDFRLTNELATTERYDISQAWAATVHRAGFGGMYAELRFTPGPTRGLALFGAAGTPMPTPRGDPHPASVRQVVKDYGIEVIDPPRYGAVTIVAP